MSKWLRVRFHANADDYRPVKWPPAGPYWCSGYAGDDSHSIVVAYVKSEEQVMEFWPEVTEIEILSEHDEPVFSSRFPKPDWWDTGMKSSFDN